MAAAGVASEWSAEAARIAAVRHAQNEALAATDVEGMKRAWCVDVCLTSSAGSVRQGAAAYAEGLVQLLRTGVTYVRTPVEIVLSTVPGLAMEKGTWRCILKDTADDAAAKGDSAGGDADGGGGDDAKRPGLRSGEYMAQWRLEGASNGGSDSSGASSSAGEWRIRSEVFVATA